MKKVILFVFLLVFWGCGQETVKNDNAKNLIQKEKKGSETVKDEDADGKEIEKDSIKKQISENPKKAKYPKLLSDLKNFEIELKTENFMQLESKEIKEWDKCEGDYGVGRDCGPPQLEYIFQLKNSPQKNLEYDNYEIYLNVYGFNEIKDIMQKFNNDLLENIETVILESGDPDKLLDKNFPIINSPGGDYGDFKRLNGKNVKGFRGLHHHTTAAGSLSNGDYFYSFKGISKDKEYLIILTAFLYSPSLNDYYENSKNRENGLDELENEESYMKALNVFKSDLNNNKTIPSLKQLDEFIQSIEIVEK